jgi:hypothetical protein
MNTPQTVCNYSLLHFVPYPETGELVNVGVLVMCQQPCLLDFWMEPEMPDRVKALFPDQNNRAFEAASEAKYYEMKRLKAMISDPPSCLRIFNEAVRPRETIFRFSEPRTILTNAPKRLSIELFSRYVQMEAPVPQKAKSGGGLNGSGHP